MSNKSIQGPTDAVSVTPTDTVNDTTAIKSILAENENPAGLNLATDGNVALKLLNGNTATLYYAAGLNHGVQYTHVLSTGTTATGIMALFN